MVESCASFWTPPSKGVVKVNFDGSLHNVGVGVVFSDEEGLFCMPWWNQVWWIRLKLQNVG